MKLMLRLNSLVGLQHLQVFLRRLVEKARGEVSVLKYLGCFLVLLRLLEKYQSRDMYPSTDSTQEP